MLLTHFCSHCSSNQFQAAPTPGSSNSKQLKFQQLQLQYKPNTARHVNFLEALLFYFENIPVLRFVTYRTRVRYLGHMCLETIFMSFDCNALFWLCDIYVIFKSDFIITVITVSHYCNFTLFSILN